MARKLTFRDLIDDARRQGRAEHLPPRTMAAIAKRCGMSRQHLYSICEGRKNPPTWTVHRIALALKLDPKTVQKAVDLTRTVADLA